MKNANRWFVVLLIFAGLQLAACIEQPVVAGKPAPARLEKVEGSAYGRVILTAKAAERIGVETAAVGSEQSLRTRRVGGRVMAAPVAASQAGASSPAAVAPRKVWVRVNLTESDRNKLNRNQPVRVLPLGLDAKGSEGIAGVLDAGAGFAEAKTAGETLYYEMDDPNGSLVPDQGVLVELPLAASSAQHLVIPVTALLYGLKGETWVYTNPEPLLYVRQAVTVDYIRDDMAHLLDGPSAGTAVVTVGGAEMLGVELGVGK